MFLDHIVKKNTKERIMKKHDFESFILRETRSKVSCDFDNLDYENIYNIISYNALFDGEEQDYIIFTGGTQIKVCTFPFSDLRVKIHHRKILNR